MTRICAAAMPMLAIALLFDPSAAWERDLESAQASAGRSQPPRAVSPPPFPVPPIADHTEIPAIENDAVAPALGATLPKCRKCEGPVWPSPVTERWRFRLYVVIDTSGKVATARIVQTLVGNAGARPVGVEGTIAPAWRDTPPARAGLAVLAAARQWQFEPPADAPLLIVTDVGVPDDVPLSTATAGRNPATPGPAPVRVGGAIAAPTKIKDVPPVYPPEALAARITGTVMIEAVIDPEGNVTNTKVLSGVPLLDDAALAAVRQWKYTPTLVNGQPVAVIMTVTSRFSLK